MQALPNTNTSSTAGSIDINFLIIIKIKISKPPYLAATAYTYAVTALGYGTKKARSYAADFFY
ncbi:hypothetical protein PKOR_11525 [Pontibacter korlensis]|uniref:Uncharacterized protein n=1 Tax=Pontibacter korlensis TaxID=400092 RepID=A0A0E3UWT1_9BACT|nr:hypothetical protein PKOR_11525 [Pontibacter korlensis]